MVELHSLICLKEGFLLLGLQTAGPLLTYIKNPYILGWLFIIFQGFLWKVFLKNFWEDFTSLSPMIHLINFENWGWAPLLHLWKQMKGLMKRACVGPYFLLFTLQNNFFDSFFNLAFFCKWPSNFEPKNMLDFSTRTSEGSFITDVDFVWSRRSDVSTLCLPYEAWPTSATVCSTAVNDSSRLIWPNFSENLLYLH